MTRTRRLKWQICCVAWILEEVSAHRARKLARRLALLWGTESLIIDTYGSFDVLLYMTEREMVREGLVSSGDSIAFTTGMPVGAGGTNVLKIHQIP